MTVIAKHRFPKSYRHPLLDQKLTPKRVNQEAKTLVKLARIVDTPTLYFVDTNTHTLYMEYVQGSTVRDYIRTGPPPDDLITLGILIGTQLAQIHNLDTIHGDLTTSNLIFRPNGSLVWIDFGLSATTTLVEDKAVDIYVLERAISSTHPNEAESLFNSILQGYSASNASSKATLKRFEDVRRRGRKRTAFG